MKEFAPFIPIVLFVFLGGGLVIWAALRQKRRAAANLQKLAARLGLEFSPGPRGRNPRRIAGARRGKTVQIFNYTTGGGDASTTWSAVTVAAAASPLTFTMKKRGLSTKIAGLFGAHEIAVGDAEFDKAWFVQANQPEFMRAALIPELRAKLMAALRAGLSGAFQLNGSEVSYSETGTFADAKRADRFVALTELACDLADVAEVATETQSKP